MNLLQLLLRTSWVSVTSAIIAALISGVSSTGLIALINLSLNNSKLPITSLAWAFAACCLLLLISTAASLIAIAYLSQQVIFKLWIDLNRRILASPLRRIEEIGSPRLLATLTEDIEAISQAAIAISNISVNVAAIVACLIYLCWLSIPVFLSMLACLLLGIFSYQLIATSGNNALKLAREQQDKLFHHFQTTTQGIKELKLHQQRREEFFLKDLQTTATSFKKYRFHGMTIFAIAGSWGLVLFFIPLGFIVFGLPQITTISTSVLSGYALTILFIILPLRNILDSLPQLITANISLAKVESLGLSLAAETNQPNLNSPIQPSVSWKRLELIGVTHAYRGEKDNTFILGAINLNFYPGEIVFIVGGNGSGKSTLVKLITGLYIPETGEIKFDNVAITEHQREWYRQQFSVVFSDFYLFENLLGLDSINLDTTTQEYLIKLQLDHKVEVKDGMLSTTALSQGQRKRLALLTAYLENRPIYIFDEWASDQDPVFKEIFYTQLLPELREKGKTVIVVSHDDRYFHLADRVIKLDYGQVQHDN
ncbi:cyclic peptide transporter [Crinalium epipsammum PCC 9333]|uniref:Cyclic peptide transporter n=1 Tax=Crinalium epipsammum PCC 9333 TaxID=1173022 RepID=K9W4J6_9CYAN|nr:cyclic peptide export ABC transporter [Crinalium epipsammum]AFZ14719.1 cyclic peptide transporter [Crinalium epipsammum PCC 9333]